MTGLKVSVKTYLQCMSNYFVEVKQLAWMPRMYPRGAISCIGVLNLTCVSLSLHTNRSSYVLSKWKFRRPLTYTAAVFLFSILLTCCDQYMPFLCLLQFINIIGLLHANLLYESLFGDSYLTHISRETSTFLILETRQCKQLKPCGGSIYFNVLGSSYTDSIEPDQLDNM